MSDTIVTSSGAPRTTIDTLNAAGTIPQSSAFSELGQKDFLRLLTVQLQQQDPFEPVDNKDMLAQMAQFSALAGTTDTNATLEDISSKLDALIEAQRAAAEAAAQAAAAASSSGTDTTNSDQGD